MVLLLKLSGAVYYVYGVLQRSLWVVLAFLTCLAPDQVLAQTTGKIAGRVIDAATGESLPGVNVVIAGTTRGSTTDLDGYYFILSIKPGTYTAKLLNNALETHMRFRHRYEVDPKYIAQLEAGGLVFSAHAPDHPIMQVLELPAERHPFFIGTQAHPEFLSRPLRPEPLFAGFMRAAVTAAKGQGVIGSEGQSVSQS